MIARQLKPHERIWLEEVRTRLASGKPIDILTMMVELRDTLPTGFTPNQIDPEYLQTAQITVAGVHALDPNAKELKDLDRLLLKIKEWITLDPHKHPITAEECATALGMSNLYVRRLLALAGTLGTFWTSAGGNDEGVHTVNITSPDALATILGYTSIETSLQERERTRQRSGPQDSWWNSTPSFTTDFEKDPTEEDNTPFNSEEQVRVNQAVEEVRAYICSTYSLSSEPLAKVNRKLDYLIDTSTRLGRKDWTIMCVGILVSLAIPQLTPSGPGVRELFAVAWNLIRHVLGGVISPPLLH
jgi:hypothetical protein